MKNKKIIFFVILFMVTMCTMKSVDLYSNTPCVKQTIVTQTSSITKPKSSTVKENAGNVRIKGIELCEQLLTTVSSSIASYAPMIDDIVVIIKDMVIDDGFFSSLTLCEKKIYVQKLERMVTMLEEQKIMVSQMRTELTGKK